MKRVGAIDIGTNTALLLVAEITDENEIHPLLEEENIVRLGEGVDASKKLKPRAVARVLNAIEEYLQKANALQAEEMVISGTSAVRDAENRSELITQIQDTFGIRMRILSGDEEARLTYFGALSNKKYLQNRILLMDIGGGSTEFIMGTQGGIQKAISLDIGSVRLTERLIKHDPISDSEFAEVQEVINNYLQGALRDWRHGAEHFVGVAGTITTLAAMDLKLEPYDPVAVDNSTLTFETVNTLTEMLRSKTLAEKKRIPGLMPERADVILCGAMILSEVMKFFGYEKVTVSDRGLRHGLILAA